MDHPDDQSPPQGAPGSEPEPDPTDYPWGSRLMLLAVAPALMILGSVLKSNPLLALPPWFEFLVVIFVTMDLATRRMGWQAAAMFIVGGLFSAFLLVEGLLSTVDLTGVWL